MREDVKAVIANDPELLQYYQNNKHEINSFISRFAIPRNEIKDVIIILKAIDEDIDWEGTNTGMTIAKGTNVGMTTAIRSIGPKSGQHIIAIESVEEIELKNITKSNVKDI